MFTEMKIVADIKNVRTVMDFAHKNLNSFNFNEKSGNKVDVVVDEIFSNISTYAYPSKKGYAIIKCGINDSHTEFIIKFIDEGIPFNPLLKKDPDINLSAEKRQIGGLGIFLVKKLCHYAKYEYKNNKNILTLTFIDS